MSFSAFALKSLVEERDTGVKQTKQILIDKMLVYIYKQ